MSYYFLVELLTWYDITKFDGHWSSNKEITQGGGRRNPPAVLDSKKPGLFRVKVLSVDSREHSSIADHLVNTGHNMKWYHFEILREGKQVNTVSSKESLLIDEEHWLTLSDKNDGRK